MRNLPTKYLLKFDETSQTCHISSSLIFRQKNFFFLSEGIVHVDDDVLKTKKSQMLKYRIPNKKKKVFCLVVLKGKIGGKMFYHFYGILTIL